MRNAPINPTRKYVGISKGSVAVRCIMASNMIVSNAIKKATINLLVIGFTIQSPSNNSIINNMAKIRANKIPLPNKSL